MGLADGDLYVSGSILSFQQMKRIYQNFRAATVPSNLQAGALWSKSTDDRLWHQGASDLLEVFTEKTTLTFENLLSNSGFGVWSQSDAAKGLATMAYDAGAKGAGAAPSVGDAAVGGTSGATAKVISYTTATGAWATNDAAGVFTLGAVTGTFIDNETVTFGGVETALVNGDTAIGVGNDPMNNDGTGAWTMQDGNITFAFDTDHYEATTIGQRHGDIASRAFTAGKLYKIEADVKDGTAAGVTLELHLYDGSINMYSSTITTAAGWVSYSWTFEAGATTSLGEAGFRIADMGGNNIELRNFSCYEITPCCTAADSLAADYHSKTSSLDIYEVKDDSTHIEKSYYGLKLVKTVASAEYYNLNKITNRAFLDQYKGKTITIGCFVYDDSGGNDNIKLQIYDGVGTSETAFFTSGSKQWLEITRTIDGSATEFTPRILCDGDVGDIAYISPIMIVFGSSIGEGNYQPKPQEIIWITEIYIPSNAFEGKTFSDIADTVLNLEADTDGRFPKGAKAVYFRIDAKDSGSAGASCYMQLSPGALGTVGASLLLWLYGQENDIPIVETNWLACDPNGDFHYNIEATGTGTFDVDVFRYFGVQVN